MNTESVILVGLPYHEFEYKTKRFWSSIEVGSDETEAHKFKLFIEKYDLQFIHSDNLDEKRSFIGYKVHSVYGDAQVIDLEDISTQCNKNKNRFSRDFDLVPKIFMGVSHEIEKLYVFTPFTVK